MKRTKKIQPPKLKAPDTLSLSFDLKRTYPIENSSPTGTESETPNELPRVPEEQVSVPALLQPSEPASDRIVHRADGDPPGEGISEEERAYCRQHLKRIPESSVCSGCQKPYLSLYWHLLRSDCQSRDIYPYPEEEPEEIERSPNSDPSSLCVSYPYKTEGLPDGDKMTADKWSRPIKTSNKIARVEAGPEYFDALEAKGAK